MLYPHINKELRFGLLLFCFILCYMAWTAVSTLFRGYFSPGASCRIALAGYLMFLSDMGVANSLFNPALAGQPAPMLDVFVWVTYVPAWTLIVVTIADDNLLL
jgi:uncharacterized membrane protein YhhN